MKAKWISRIRRATMAACAAFLFVMVVNASDRVAGQKVSALRHVFSQVVAHAAALSAHEQQNQYPGGRGERMDFTSPRMVRRAQSELYNRNLYHGLIDGQLNPQTRQALADFQRKNGLQVTGDLNQQTAARLGLMGRGSWSQSADRQLAASIYRKAQSLLTNYQSSLGIQVNDISARLASNQALNEGDLDLLLQTNSFLNAAAWYQQATTNSSNIEGPRIAASILQSSADRVETSLGNARQNSQFRQEWASIQADLSRVGVSESTEYDAGGESGTGHFQWQGIVDGSDNIRLRGSFVDIDHLTAGPIQQATHQLSAPLPIRPVQVTLHKVRGRGQIRLLEQPAASNNYTAVVQVNDQGDSGSAWYEFTLDW